MLLKMTLVLPNDIEYVPTVRTISTAALERAGVAAEDIADANLILTEICNNAAHHAYSSPGRFYLLDLEYLPGCVRITVRDRGRGFDRDAVPIPDLEQTSGRGLWLVEQLADRVEFEPLEDGGTCVRARLDVRYRDADAREAALQEARALEEFAPELAEKTGHASFATCGR